jgi:ATP-dependent RNA helicase RhlE
MSYAYRTKRTTNRRGASGGRRSHQNNKRGSRGQYIDPIKFVKKAQPQEELAFTPINTFADFDLEKLLQENLDAQNYKAPSPIQDEAIPHGLNGRDVIGIASTGTGKTAAFILPVIQKLIKGESKGAIIVAPTRELAQQIEVECQKLAKNSNLFGTLLIGGTGMGKQLKDLRYNPEIVIGTPGRIKDHIGRKTLKLHNFDIVVLDEVDRMLDMGFVNDVTEILSNVSSDRQSYFFSATMDARVRKLIDTFVNDPVTIMLKPSSSSDNIHQDVVMYQSPQQKMDQLHDLLISKQASKVIVFDETKRSVERLSKELASRGFDADALHGGKTQGQRQRALDKFKKSQVTVLVATDVAARGIDVADVTHVINYSIPQQYDDYIHRIGRTGRAGQIGYAFTFVPQGYLR